MAINKLRNMTIEESIELLQELKEILKERSHFGYNTSLINPFQKQIVLIDMVINKFIPNENTNILDIHGMSIINSILEVNAISNDFINKFASNVTRYEDGSSPEPEYASKIRGIDAEFISYMNTKGYDGNAELSRVKKLLSDFSADVDDSNLSSVRIRPVNLTMYGSEENITEAFDYHLLIYLTKCLKVENDIFKLKQDKFNEMRNLSKLDGSYKMFHTTYFNDASTCRSSCVGLCSASCDETCYGCGGECYGQCTAKCADCSMSCTDSCARDCTGGCKGCSGCSNECEGCLSACSANCGDACTNGCGGCTGSCFGNTTGATITCGCGGKCTTDCSSDCNSEASAPTPISVDPEPPVVIEPEPTKPVIPNPGLDIPDNSYIPSTPSQGCRGCGSSCAVGCGGCQGSCSGGCRAGCGGCTTHTYTVYPR